MKFAQKISSRRRSIWKAWSSCSPASASTPAASGASAALAGWTRLAAGFEQRRHGRLGEPVDLEAGDAAPQLAGDRDVAPGVTEADRGRDEQGPPRPRAGARPGAALRGGRVEAGGELVDQPVDDHRVAGHRDVARAGELDALSAGELGDQAPALGGLAVVAVALDDEHRAAHAPAQRFGLLLRRTHEVGGLHQQRLERAVEPVGDGVLDLLGRVWLREHLAEEELEEVPVMGAHVMAVLLLPARRRRPAPRPGARARPPRQGCGGASAGTPGAIATMPSTRSGCSAAIWIEGWTPSPQIPPSTAVSVDVASITARQSDARQRSIHGPDTSGQSELPLPRPS